jgi:hypothetical protein
VVAVLRPDEPVAAVVVPATGIVSVVPATTWCSVDRPLAVASALVERPLFAAIPDSVSPGATRWPAARAGSAGRSAAAARAAPARRAVRSMDTT